MRHRQSGVTLDDLLREYPRRCPLLCSAKPYLKDATALDDYRVAVVFANGERGIFDCRPYLSMGYYKPLNDPALFKRVGVSYGWLNWPGDIDIGADDVWTEAVRN